MAQAAEIKGLFAVGARNYEIIDRYRLSPQAVCHIKKNRTGKDVEPISGDEARELLRFIRRDRGRREKGLIVSRY